MASSKKPSKSAAKKPVKPVNKAATKKAVQKAKPAPRPKSPAKPIASKAAKAAPVKAKASRKIASYAKPDLNIFRANIARQIEDTREELTNLTEHLMDAVSGEYEEENSVYSLHMADQGTDAMEREKDFLQAQRLNDYVKKLDEAMKRIEDGSYGVCVVCDRLIEKQRLLAVPVTQKHVDCKNREAANAPRNVPRDEEPLHHFPESN